MKTEEIKLTGEVRGHQTKLEFEERNGILVPHDTGIVVPGSESDWKVNTLDNNLLYYLAYKIGTHTTNRALDNLFVSDGAVGSVGAAQDGFDGIAYEDGGVLTHLFVTTLNAGGDEAVAYAEFLGYIDGAVNMTDTLEIGSVYINSTTLFTKTFASVAITENVLADRRYHHYWKFTLS